MTKDEVTFASILKNQLYRNRDVLYSMVPPTGFLHRTEQKNELILELSPILMKSAVSCIFVFGNPGTGKTGLVNELLHDLDDEAKKQKIELTTVYVNCSEFRTENVIFLEILAQLDKSKDYPRMGWTKAKVLSEVNTFLKQNKLQILVVLDEVDYVLKEEGDDILYRLSRINNQIASTVSTVIISNDVKVADFIKPRTQSTFGRVKVIFSPYTSEELFDILNARAKEAFQKGVVSEPVIRKISEIEAQRDGDARKALELLDSCAKIAIAKKRDKISLDLVDEADESLERDHILNIMSTLTKQQKLVYMSILKNQKKVMAGTDIYKLYLETCESTNVKPLSERRVRSLLINLGDLGLIQSEVGWLSDLRKKSRKVTINIESALRNKVSKMLRDSI